MKDYSCRNEGETTEQWVMRGASQTLEEMKHPPKISFPFWLLVKLIYLDIRASLGYGPQVHRVMLEPPYTITFK